MRSREASQPREQDRRGGKKGGDVLVVPVGLRT